MNPAMASTKPATAMPGGEGSLFAAKYCASAA